MRIPTPPEFIRDPLKDNAQATLVFTVPTDGGTTDSLGNYVPNTTTETIEAILHKTGSRSGDEADLNAAKVNVRLRATNPKKLPGTIEHGAEAEATINGYKGTFVIALEDQNPHMIDNDGGNRLGDRFSGVFRRRTA